MDRATAERIYAPAAVQALEEFPIDAESPRLVVMNENVTFRVRDRRDGASYVFRLHRPGYHDLAELNAERVWLRALAEGGIAVPSPVPATDGRDYVPVSIPATGETRFCGLTRWIEGEIVAEVLKRTHDERVVEQYFAQLGSIMASMHNQASGWSAPATFTRHAFDADGLMGDAPFWGRFWEHDALTDDERRTLLATREQIYGALSRYGNDPATFSMIHADLHHNNVLVDGERLTVIDFDDAGFGWHQYDIAVALYHSRATPNFEAVTRAFLDSYRTRRTITDEALALVPMFQLIRGMAIIGWKHLRPEVEWPDGTFDGIKAGVMAGCATFEPPY
jgi:Ser/Thr protein kinase RdoA (MazF antagonist)